MVLGVTVLIVVLSVFGGFEQLIKKRVLSYTPHIYVERVLPWQNPEEFPDYNAVKEWRGLQDTLSSVDGIQSAYALVNDYVILDQNGAVAPVSMQAIDTSNTDQSESLQALITEGNGTADMGLGESVVVSSMTASRLNIHLGDTIQVHSSRNIQEVRPVLERLDNPALVESHSEAIKVIQKDLEASFSDDPENKALEIVPISDLKAIYYDSISPLYELALRPSEQQIINDTLIMLEEGVRSTPDPDDSGVFSFPSGHTTSAIELLGTLLEINAHKEDIEDMKNMKSLVLPKDLHVVGIYQATPHAVSPDIFVPLPVGQDLTALGDGVRGIALILDDPYDAEAVIGRVLPVIENDPAWQARTWMQDHQAQFSWIKTQRQLLSFCLSFIMLVSAFSIMAVMFTVTIQKKREIGVMKALGAAPAQLVRVFVYQGVIIGFVGAILGIVTGYTVVVQRNAILKFFADWGFDPFPSDINGFEGLPATINPSEFIAVFIFAFVMCIVATFVPAIIASRSDAAKSLRNT